MDAIPQFNHYVLTRFNVSCELRNGAVPDSDWLCRRFTLFEMFTLPSLASQSNKRFRWLIFFGHHTPDHFRDRISELSESGIFIPCFVDSLALGHPTTVCKVRSFIEDSLVAPAEFLITSRIDNDDAVSPDYIQSVQDHFRNQAFEFIAFPNGYNLCQSKLYHKRLRTDNFVSLIERFAECRTVWCEKAQNLPSIKPLTRVESKPLWVQVVHGENVANRVHADATRVPIHLLKQHFCTHGPDGSCLERPGAVLLENGLRRVKCPLRWLKRKLFRACASSRVRRTNTSLSASPRQETGTFALPSVPTEARQLNNPLLAYFESNKGRRINKWMHYSAIYERHFSQFRGSSPTVLEIGVSHGGSLEMWKDYFGEGARIFGIDIKPQCRQVEQNGICVLIGDQADRGFLLGVKRLIGPIDIVIDDGGHTMSQQTTSFEELFPAVTENGVYVVEDLHTSYWKSRLGRMYGGGLWRRDSFIEYSKRLIDQLNAWQIEDKRVIVNDFTRTAYSMIFYTSMLVIQKGRVDRPCARKTGHPVI